ncbi:hypothetical protein BH09SUM1_BH09SUM1_33410 [soil metagenome]
MRLLHLPPGASPLGAEPPSEAERAELALTAPPMNGGEYLSPDALLAIWTGLASWCGEAAEGAGGLAAFLHARAPGWRQVGLVCFHLAENKADPERPFAFMATFVSGLNTAGQPRHLPLRQALTQFADAKDRGALVKLLVPVQAAAERCAWVKEMVDSGEIYQPKAWSPERAYQLLRSVPELEASGLTVRLPNWWQRRARPRVSVTIGKSNASAIGLNTMLDFNVAVALGDENLSPDEVRALLSGGEGLVVLRGQWVEVDREKLKEAIDHWEDLRKGAGKGGVSFIEGMRLLAGASGDLAHEDEADALRPWAYVNAGGALKEALSRLRTPGLLDEEKQIAGLHATLRPYQQKGVAWLRFATGLGLGACLADDMGLGKTIQILALLLSQKERRGPSLLVVPASLLGNWRSEAARFAPSLRTLFLHPAETPREEIERIERTPEESLAAIDLAVTTYSMVHRQEWLAKVAWDHVILDEAQAIRNSGTRQSKAAKRLPARSRIALTGTPVENRLGDLWSIFDFLNPGLLGSGTVFKSFVKKMDGRKSDQYAPLRRLVSPYILRRMKTDRAIIPDLPDKVEVARSCGLAKQQVRIYEQVVESMKASLENATGIRRRGVVLELLLRLKQVCNHPSQFSGDGVYDSADSGKFAQLTALCEELAERQERVLIFTQFREIIDPISRLLEKVFHRPGLVLHGEIAVAKRSGLVEQFQRPDGPPFFVLSLKAGGTGLTLTAASHVVHFDRWWNPAVEDQATDRAYRIGQKRNVLVHKFVTAGTIEERIDEMIAEKRRMAGQILQGGGEMDLTSLTDNQLLDLVRLDVSRAAMEG